MKMLPVFFYQAPFFRFLLPFIAGIVWGFQVTTVPATTGIWICSALFILLCGLLRQGKGSGFTCRNWFYGLFLNLLLGMAGILVVSIHQFTPIDRAEYGDFLVVVEDPPVEKENSIQAAVRIRAHNTDSSWVAYGENAIVYFRKDTLSRKVKQGDLLIVNTTLNPVQNEGNPYEFDYRGYLSKRLISRSAFVESGKWQYLDSYAQGPLRNLSNRIRIVLLDVYRRAGLQGNELAVASALVLGYKADLDDILRGAYSASGAMHVLAVSGLHVGIIYLIFSSLLNFIPFLRQKKWIKSLFLLCILWLYALVTGMPPSVMRAATMFSFIIAGEALRRRAYIYNSIAASAFLLLVINPALLYDVGFQLSYTAVAAIVFFHPKIYSLLSFNKWLPDQAWNLTCVSVAAQIGTAPLSLFYFHQFPTYFALTNFLVIPGAVAIIYGSFFLFAVSPIPLMLEWAGWALDKILFVFNSGIFLIEKLPGSVVWGIRFQGWEIVAAYLFVAVISIWMLSARKPYLFASLAVCLFWICGSVMEEYHDLSRKRLIVYQTQGNSLLQFISGRDNTVWYESRKSSFNADIATKPQQIAMKLNESRYATVDTALHDSYMDTFQQDLYVNGNFIEFAGKRLAVFSRTNPPPVTAAPTHPVNVDVVVLIQNVNTTIPQIMQICHPATIVVDASNALSRINRWEKGCADIGVTCHRTDRDGAFILDIK
jgi:competence protein ComEC